MAQLSQFDSIIGQLHALTDKLKEIRDEHDRRELLKQFRVLLKQADAKIRPEGS